MLLLGDGSRIRGVQAWAAFINLCVQLGRTLEVNTVEHLISSVVSPNNTDEGSRLLIKLQCLP